ncbi:MAG: sugar phosphate isomerase/epimerase [Pedosphaera parvula]|nr:sugar phosphate isomerase/epimerase [Pedosphaera parvula]
MNPDLNRREFLKLGSAALAVAGSNAVPADSVAAPATQHRLRKGYKLGGSFGGKRMPLLDQFKIFKEAGYAGVEPMAGWDENEVLRARDATGLAIPSICCNTHWKSPLSDPDPAVRAITVEALKNALRQGKLYGARSVLLVPAVVNEQVSYADAWTRTQAEIRKAVPLAEKLGVKIVIENVWNDFLLSPLEAARYVDEFNSPAVGWHFDVGNVVAFGWPAQWIRILGKRIATVHIKEYSRKKRDEEGLRKGFEVEYLEGDNNWPAVMKALDEISFDGWGIAEPAYHPKGVDPVERVKEISRRMDKIFAS